MNISIYKKLKEDGELCYRMRIPGTGGIFLTIRTYHEIYQDHGEELKDINPMIVIMYNPTKKYTHNYYLSFDKNGKHYQYWLLEKEGQKLISTGMEHAYINK